MNRPIRKCTACCLIILMFTIGIITKGEAGFAPSEIIVSPSIPPHLKNRAEDLQKIQKALEIKMLRERLDQLGFTPEEIQTRLSQVSDQQLHQLATRLDEIRSGGDGLGVVITVLVIAILVVILLHITGHKIIVTSK